MLVGNSNVCTHCQGSHVISRFDLKQIFRPSALKLKGLEYQDYLGAALVVAVNNSISSTFSPNLIFAKCSMIDQQEADIVLIKLDSPDIRLLRHAIMQKFNINEGMWSFKIKFKDEEGDFVVISDDNDLVRAVHGGRIRLFIQPLVKL
jgi:hypothetical protein